MINTIAKPLNWFLGFMSVIPSPMRSLVYWTLSCFAVCIAYRILHMWLKG